MTWRKCCWGCLWTAASMSVILWMWTLDQQHQHTMVNVRNRNFWLYPGWTESETLGLEPRYVCFNKPSRRFWCMPKFDNTVLDLISSVQSLSCVRLFSTPGTADHMLTCKKVCCGLASKSWFHYREQQGLVNCKRAYEEDQLVCRGDELEVMHPDKSI